jgi:hypothetical protein
MGNFIAFHFPNETTKRVVNFLPIIFAVGSLLSFLRSRKDDKKETFVPLNEKVYTYTWIGASIGWDLYV